ncbi:chromate resistance protein ChrB domain-containing protein [Methylovirgula sp. 4M-Z18]|uniref:chromate resistance protein ChrB domain-containing protein n=1 Tax=Methylovirgula sp. 4M-Z18 TaxID=2293567 RepID=UPI000E2E874F|nr:sulfurtransferase/chromate resistance protein [Methylovirgula sp. 4M-Z18]RFB81202.1 sulfurtransferase [Methylovirgula sp. 4M-Z18]
MSSFTFIAPEKLARLIGTPKCPALLDVRAPDDSASNPSLVPGAYPCSHENVLQWAATFRPSAIVTIGQRGKTLSQGAAAQLRVAGVHAEVLEGGFEAWQKLNLPLVPAAKIPPRGPQGCTVWVTRARPKIDRIACPWLIRRFVDPNAQFLYVAPPEVEAVGQAFSATPFDIEGVFWSHRADTCTFDTMIEEFGLETEPLLRLAAIVRGADTARLDLAPEAAGLLAASLGLSRMYGADLEQLDAGCQLYDAFYRWCRDATDETHNWPTNKP